MLAIRRLVRESTLETNISKWLCHPTRHLATSYCHLALESPTGHRQQGDRQESTRKVTLELYWMIAMSCNPPSAGVSLVIGLQFYQANCHWSMTMSINTPCTVAECALLREFGIYFADN